MSQKFFFHFFEIRHKNHPPFFTKGIPQYPEHLLFFYLLFITRDLWIPVSTRTRYAWSCLAGFSNELCTRVYRNYGDLRRLSCTTTAPTIHRTSPFKLFRDSWTAQVALFSYNFGDFRHEISMYRPLSQNYSYAYNRFFFTDELGAAGALKDDGWIVCRVAANAACTRAASLVKKTWFQRFTHAGSARGATTKQAHATEDVSRLDPDKILQIWSYPNRASLLRVCFARRFKCIHCQEPQ